MCGCVAVRVSRGLRGHLVVGAAGIEKACVRVCAAGVMMEG